LLRTPPDPISPTPRAFGKSPDIAEFQKRFSFRTLGKKLTELAADAEESVVEVGG